MLKVGSKKSSAPAVPEMPMADPMAGGADPMAGGADPMADPMAGGEDPMADPMAGGMDPMAGGEDPMAGGEDPMAGGENETDDSTMSIINQLSDEDREAVRSYAESMLSKHGGKNDSDSADPMAGGEGEETPEVAPAIPEGICFTKKQLKESFGVGRNSEEMQRVKDKTIGKVNRHNPFLAPNFE